MTNYASKEYLDTLKMALEVFIPSTINETIKPKREAAIKKAYDGVYDIQLAANSIIGDLEVSQLLGMNEVVVPHIIQEYAKLSYVLKLIESKLKALNQFSELKDAVTALKDALKIKDLGRHLYNDLEMLSGNVSIDIDLKASVGGIKNYVPDDKFLTQLGIKQNVP